MHREPILLPAPDIMHNLAARNEHVQPAQRYGKWRNWWFMDLLPGMYQVFSFVAVCAELIASLTQIRIAKDKPRSVRTTCRVESWPHNFRRELLLRIPYNSH